MAGYDPDDPKTWDPTDVVDVKESARRISLLRPKELSPNYLQRNLTRRADYPKAVAWEINSGRAWLWGEVLAWFKDTGRA